MDHKKRFTIFKALMKELCDFKQHISYIIQSEKFTILKELF